MKPILIEEVFVKPSTKVRTLFVFQEVAFFVLALVTKSYELLAYSEVTVKVALIICLVLLTYIILGGR